MEEFVSQLKSSLLFQDSSLVVLKAIWKSEGPSLCSLPKQSLSVGEVRYNHLELIVCFERVLSVKMVHACDAFTKRERAIVVYLKRG